MDTSERAVDRSSKQLFLPAANSRREKRLLLTLLARSCPHCYPTTTHPSTLNTPTHRPPPQNKTTQPRLLPRLRHRRRRAPGAARPAPRGGRRRGLCHAVGPLAAGRPRPADKVRFYMCVYYICIYTPIDTCIFVNIYPSTRRQHPHPKTKHTAWPTTHPFSPPPRAWASPGGSTPGGSWGWAPPSSSVTSGKRK